MAAPGTQDDIPLGKPVLALDIDEVCAQFVPALIRYHNEKYLLRARSFLLNAGRPLPGQIKFALESCTVLTAGLEFIIGRSRYGTDLKVETFHSYRFAEVWGGTDEDSVTKVFDFFTTRHFLEDLEPVDGSVDAVTALVRAGFDVIGVTSRQLVIEDATRTWLERHFQGLFRDVCCGNHWVPNAANPDLTAEGVIKKTKREMVEAIGAVALVDDSCKYVQELQGSAGGPNYRKSILFGNYAWNQAEPGSLPTNCTRVENWDEALEELLPLLDGESSGTALAKA